MSTRSTLAIAALVAAGLAAPALAASFAPKNTNFLASGPVTIITPQGVLNCTLTSDAVVTGGGEVEFINASFTGSEDACFENSFSQTPYYVIAKGMRRGKILGVSGSGNLLGACGPGALPFTAAKTGVWTLEKTTLPGGCKISGSLTTSPAITVAP
jgi:hypothetical protein